MIYGKQDPTGAERRGFLWSSLPVDQGLILGIPQNLFSEIHRQYCLGLRI